VNAANEPVGTPTGPEVAWFGALCDDDHRWLGVPDPDLRSSFAHCSDIVATADRLGYDSVLLPSGYDLGIDPAVFAGGVATVTQQIRLLVAVRCAELWPPQLARQLATIEEALWHSGSGRRLDINIISSDLPGAPMESESRYERTLEVMTILGSLLAGQPVEHHGEHYDIELEAPRIAKEMAARRGGVAPPMYFGGLSDAARRVAAEAADVFLMWPDTLPAVRAIIDDMRARAAANGRELRFGYRVHVIVRETEGAARDAATELVSRLDPLDGEAIRRRSLDSASVGVTRQAELRGGADDDGFVEEHLWTGVGRARSGCGAAIVGDPDQVVEKLRRYQELGIDTFILSGYPHLQECELVARHVLPALRG
jgi:alkanesulfonate monooxygenase